MAGAAGLFGLFHLLVIAGVIPSTVVWGGRITDRRKLIVMESISFIVLIGMGALGYARGFALSRGEAAAFLGIAMWVLAALFTFNTVGNLFAKTRFERYAFTPVTMILAYLSVRLALGR